MAQTRPLQLRVRVEAEGPGRGPQLAASLSWPGRVEKAIVSLTLFLLAFDFPSLWFENRDNKAPGQIIAGGDIKTLAIFLALYALSFSRLVNNGNLILAVMRRDRLLSAFIIWIGASTFWSINPGLTARRTAALVLTTGFAVFLVIRFPLQEIIRMSAISFGIGTLLSYFFIFAIPASGVAGSGWIGIFDNKNSLGRHEALATIVSLMAASSDKRWRSVFALQALASMGLILGATSATAIIGMLAILGNYTVFRLFRSRDTLFGAVVFSLFATGLGSVVLAYGNLERLAGLLGKDVSLTGRTDLWSAVWREIGRRPLLGWGYDAYWNGFFSPAHELWVEMDWLPPHSHNAILDYLLVIGIPGAGLFVAAFVRGMYRATRFIRENPGGLALFPIMMLSYGFIFSLTEAGVVGRTARWVLFVVALLTAGSNESTSTSAAGSSDRRMENDADEADVLDRGDHHRS